MKIAWYTPYSTHSAIGHYSQIVVDALRQLDIDVQVVRSELRTTEVRASEPHCKSEKWRWASDFDRSTKSLLSAFDLIVYNVGDHHDYHHYCFRHQPVVPGLTVLHDFSLHGALNHYCHVTAPENGTYRDHLAAEWNDAAVQEYDEALADDDEFRWWQDGSSKFPVYRWAMRDTLAVVTHAEFYSGEVASRIGCPVKMIPLAYDTPCHSIERPTRGPQDKLTILTVGAVNANKRYEAIIQAIAKSEQLRNRIEYRIVGTVNDSGKKRIEYALRQQEHPVDVTLTGCVDRASLEKELENADAIACLRFPALEGASASVVEALQSGKPVIVCRTGCYAEIPDDLAFQVSPDDEFNDISRALHALVNDYDTAWERGQRARAWALERHSATNYVDQLLRFIPEVLYNQPVMELTDRIGQQLADWRVRGDSSITNRIEIAMNDLFGGPHDKSRAA